MRCTPPSASYEQRGGRDSKSNRERGGGTEAAGTARRGPLGRGRPCILQPRMAPLSSATVCMGTIILPSYEPAAISFRPVTAHKKKRKEKKKREQREPATQSRGETLGSNRAATRDAGMPTPPLCAGCHHEQQHGASAVRPKAAWRHATIATASSRTGRARGTTAESSNPHGSGARLLLALALGLKHCM